MPHAPTMRCALRIERCAAYYLPGVNPDKGRTLCVAPQALMLLSIPR